MPKEQQITCHSLAQVLQNVESLQLRTTRRLELEHQEQTVQPFFPVVEEVPHCDNSL